jgi:4,5-DOPA dioxygenase extradiol
MNTKPHETDTAHGAPPAASPYPVWFLAHGSPMLAIQDTPYTRTLASLPRRVKRPAAVLVISAHWQTAAGVRVLAAARPGTIHDFGGFDRSLYDITYPAPGDPALAAEVVGLLGEAGFAVSPDPSRGYDHGAWVPLRWTFPGADLPVIQVSLPVPATPAAMLRLGRALAPIRRRGVLMIGSGGVVHNLRTVSLETNQAPVPHWAAEFDRWVGDRLAELDVAGLADYEARSPHAALAVPTPEHFQPLLVALGALDGADRVVPLFEGFQHGTLSLRSISLESP